MQLDVFGALKLALDDLVGTRIAVLGIPGSGKSYTARVLLEEWLALGLPLTIVDIDGEYYTLRDRFPQLEIYGGSHGQSFPIPEQLATRSFREGVPVLLDFSDSKKDAMFDYLLPYFEHLWQLTAPEDARKPYAVLVEEAHEFIPQGRVTPIKKAITDLAARGRKRGVTTILVSQRSQKVDKDSLTACQFYFLHEVIHPNDLSTYQALLPLPSRRVLELVGGLKNGQAIFRAGKIVHVVSIRQAQTRHAGATPEWKRKPAPTTPIEADVMRPSPVMLKTIQTVLEQPLHLRLAQLAMDTHNAHVYRQRLPELWNAHQFDEARGKLEVYAAQVWRLLALRHAVESNYLEPVN